MEKKKKKKEPGKFVNRPVQLENRERAWSNRLLIGWIFCPFPSLKLRRFGQEPKNKP